MCRHHIESHESLFSSSSSSSSYSSYSLTEKNSIESERQKLIKESKELKEKVLQKELDTERSLHALYVEASKLPNLLSSSTPIGAEGSGIVIESYEREGKEKLGKIVIEAPKEVKERREDILKRLLSPPSSSSSSIESSKSLLDHLTLCKLYDWLDLDRAGEVVGTRFYYLKNELCLLENALIQYALNKLIRKGFIPMHTPDIIRSQYIDACGFQPRDVEQKVSQIYRVNIALYRGREKRFV